MAREIDAEYCIAGGGIAGLLLASRLAATGKKLVLLEQGPRFSERDRSGMLQRRRTTLNDGADYNDGLGGASITPCTSAAAGGGVAEWDHIRLFGLGGSALHYEAIMVRPRAEDLEAKTRCGRGRDWPIAYAELEPWLAEAERETGVAGSRDYPYASPRSGPYPMPAHPFSYFDREIFAPALQRLGMSGHACPRAINSQPYRGRSECLGCRVCRFCPTAARYSPDRVHLPMAERHPNVEVLPNVSLRRLETSRKGDRVVAAHAMGVQDRSPLLVRARRYIVAMGGVETPRMLLLSAGGGVHRDGLGNMGGQLGRRFSDHLHPYVTYEVGRDAGSRLGFETMISEHFRAEVDRREQPSFTMFASPAMDWYPIGIEATAWATQDEVLSLDALRESIPRMVVLLGMMELEGAGVLELDRSKTDAFGDPLAKITMKLTEWDRRGPAKLAELAPRLGEAMGAANVSEMTSAEFGLGYHPSGGTAMAESPDDGVCDTDLKVFGLDNLYLASNAVFPHLGGYAPTLTIAALSLRLAAHLES